MAISNLISLGGIYLTSDMTAGGDRCLTKVTGLDRLKLSKTGSTKLAADGTPKVFLCALKGAPVSITVVHEFQAQFDAVVAVFEAFVADKTPKELTIEGTTGNWAGLTKLLVVPNFPNPIQFPGDFIDDYIREVTLNVRTA